jgi:signal transduction histidine kinase
VDDAEVAGPNPLIRSWSTAVVSAGLVAALAAMSVRADVIAYRGRPWLAALDLGVGLLFVASGIAMSGPLPERLLVGSVGVAWLAASLIAGARTLHQGILAIALLAFPSGRLRGPVPWTLAVAATFVAAGALPQLGTAALFVAVGACHVLALTERREGAGYVVTAASLVAGSLVLSWWMVRREGVIPEYPVTYAVSLGAVAVALLAATRFGALHRRELADRALVGERPARVPGLRAVLSQALGDPDLSIEVEGMQPAAGGRQRDRERTIPVLDGDRRVAVVRTVSSAVDDGATRDAVATAVRLSVTHERLLRDEQHQLAELEASQSRLLAAGDRERERVAARLRDDVDVSLRRAEDELRQDPTAMPATAGVPFRVAVTEIEAARLDVDRLVAGVPAHPLGSGMLSREIGVLAGRVPFPVTIRIDPEAIGSVAAETALFYVCAEALTNAVKHAGASDVELGLTRVGRHLELTVVDNGRGGADPTGSGLQGLADRLSAAGGRLDITGPTGGGTRVVARVPLDAAGPITG